MIVNPPENAVAYPTPVTVPEIQPAPLPPQGLHGVFPADGQQATRKRNRLAAIGVLGGGGASLACTTLSISAPEALVTTVGGATCSAPTSSTVDCARGVRVNTTLREVMGKVKQGYRGLKKDL